MTRRRRKKTADSLSISFNTMIMVPKNRMESKYNNCRQSTINKIRGGCTEKGSEKRKKLVGKLSVIPSLSRMVLLVDDIRYPQTKTGDKYRIQE
jgi:hypothetical protein